MQLGKTTGSRSRKKSNLEATKRESEKVWTLSKPNTTMTSALMKIPCSTKLQTAKSLDTWEEWDDLHLKLESVA